MMKKLKTVVLLTTLLFGLLSVSCSEENWEDNRLDEDLVGTWKLENIFFSVNASDKYIEEILLLNLQEENGFLYRLSGGNVFADTIRFDGKGLFMETNYLYSEEDILESMYDALPVYKISGDNLSVDFPAFSSVLPGKAAQYKLLESLLSLEIEINEEYILSWLQGEEYETAGLKVDIRFTQIYSEIE